MPGHEKRASHADAKGFGFVASGNDATVIVAQYHDRPVIQFGPEEAFAGTIKAITIYNCLHNKY
jgi:hypothetical protein